MTPQVNNRNGCLNKWIMFRILKTTKFFSFVLTFVRAAITTKNGGEGNGQAGKYQISSCCCSFYWKTICIFWCLISSSAVNLCRVHDVTNKSAWHGCVWALSYNPFQLVPTLLGLAPLGGSVWYLALSPGSRRSELRWKYDMRATPSQKLKLQFFLNPTRELASLSPTPWSPSLGEKKL